MDKTHKSKVHNLAVKPNHNFYICFLTFCEYSAVFVIILEIFIQLRKQKWHLNAAQNLKKLIKYALCVQVMTEKTSVASVYVSSHKRLTNQCWCHPEGTARAKAISEINLNKDTRFSDSD